MLEETRTLPGIDRGKHCQHACGAVARFKLSVCLSADAVKDTAAATTGDDDDNTGSGA